MNKTEKTYFEETGFHNESVGSWTGGVLPGTVIFTLYKIITNHENFIWHIIYAVIFITIVINIFKLIDWMIYKNKTEQKINK